jgi:CHASE1-domain containing sensor protein
MTELAGHIRRWQPARHVWPIVAAALLGLTVAVTAWFAVAIWEKRLARAKFTAVASDYATVLQNGLNDYLSKLIALSAFYDASLEVDPQEFKIFTEDHARL